MANIKVYNLDIPVWNYKYNLIIEKDHKKINKFFNISHFNETVNGAFMEHVDEDGKLFNIVWIRDLKNVPTLTHEVLHMVFNIAKSKGLEYNIGSEESYTYLMGFIIDQILNDRGEPEIIKF